MNEDDRTKRREKEKGEVMAIGSVCGRLSIPLLVNILSNMNNDSYKIC